MSVGFFDERRGSYLGPKGLPTNATVARPCHGSPNPATESKVVNPEQGGHGSPADEVQNDNDEENVGMNSKATKADTEENVLNTAARRCGRSSMRSTRWPTASAS